MQNISTIVVRTNIAAAVACSLALGQLKIVQLPSGGSVTLATLPIVIIALTQGVRIGVTTGGVAGLCHLIVGGTIVHPLQIAFDYLGAWMVLGFCGVAAGKSIAFQRFCVLGVQSMSLAVFTISGAVFFMPQSYGDGVSAAALMYSLGYNFMNVAPEAVVLTALVPGMVARMTRQRKTSARVGVRSQYQEETPARPPSIIPTFGRSNHEATPSARFIDCRPAPLGLFNSGTNPSA